MKRVVLVLALACFAIVPVYAETIAGSTKGCFGSSCVPGVSATYGGLSYATGSFTAVPNGDGSVTGVGGVTGTNNLGTFTLTTASFTYNNTFTLLITFTSPGDASPSSGTYNASIVGTVTGTGNGLFVDFDNSWQNFTSAAGNFRFQVNDVSLTAPGTVNVTGNVQATPEPASLMLLSAGLLGLGGLVRRRK